MTGFATFDDYLNRPSDMQPHLMRLTAQVHALEAKTIVELGTRQGFSTRALCQGAGMTGGTVYAIDINVKEPPFEHEALKFIHGDDLTPEVSSQVPDEIDLLFIDTSHQMLHTYLELRIYGTRVRSGGFVVCHDTSLDGVILPLSQFAHERVGKETRGRFFWMYPESHGLGVLEIR